jgi:hypothetical protein
METRRAKSIAFYVYLKLTGESYSVWYKESEADLKIDTEGLFQSTLEEFVKLYAKEQGFNSECFNNDEYLSFISDVSEAINRVWNIYNEFSGCFTNEEVTVNPDYVIQKAMGIRVLHKLFSDIYKNKGNLEDSLAELERVLITSNLEFGDWKRGGKLSTLFIKEREQGVINEIKGIPVF